MDAKFANNCVVLEGGITPIAPFFGIKGLTRMAVDRGEKYFSFSGA